MDYKSTLNLPKTDFAMKADLPKREPLALKKWQELGIYQLIQQKTKNKNRYILHDGPPYANGDIHIGHVLNKTLKDIIVKYKTMAGNNCPYLPGWDCHGLPVEHQLFKELKINKNQINQLDFRKKAYDYALKFVDIQKQQFERLGVFGDWKNSYLTLDKVYEEAIVRSFAELVKKGYIYRGLKPVNWCFRCETALAEAEVEYEDYVSPSIFVKFKVKESDNFPKDTYLVIWTTTPWTLMANIAVAAHPDFAYLYLKTDKGNLILCRDLTTELLSKFAIEKYELIREIKGKQLEGLVYEHPFLKRGGEVVLADYVSKEEGSGLVHIAPGHGSEDYATGLKYKLEVIMPVDAKGNFDSTVSSFSGINVLDSNKIIIDKLKNNDLLLRLDNISHSYPHCWRCKSPIIFRATKQWFLDIEHSGLRKKLLKAIEEEVKWVPESGRERIRTMVELRPDWCLSRQRFWGVPIPALVCNNCKEEFLEPKIIENFAKFVLKEGSDCWFKRDVDDFLPQRQKCPYCGSVNFSKGNDILDVWFDSGVSNQAVLKKRKDLKFPSDLYLEGSDQHRGWFQSSLIPSMCIDGISPFLVVLTHGFVVDGEGRKMSKSLGNVISPFDIIKDYGVDILRLWVASSDYNEDIRISPEIVTRLSEAYRKIRNTARFILSNLYDFKPDFDSVDYNSLKRIDKWIMVKCGDLLESATKSYEDFQFNKAYKLIYDFCNEDLSMYYLDMVKGRLYTYSRDSLARRAAQTVIYSILDCLLRLISPILVFTAEEIWQHLPKRKEEENCLSAHLLNWPRPPPISSLDVKQIKEDMAPIIGLIPTLSKALEEKRTTGLIGSSFDAKINILTNDEIHYKYLESLKEDLTEVFKVSTVNIERGGNLTIGVTKADGKKCSRCWNYSLEVGSDSRYPEICEKCIQALK
ncbi:MAG: isoleucine--tRNA ligase [Candidatus Omnitrophota bacterium]